MNSNPFYKKIVIFCLFFRQNKDRFLLPYIILTWISIFLLFVLLIYIPVDWFGDGIIKEKLIALLNSLNQAEKNEVIRILGIYYSVVWISIFLTSGKFCIKESLIYIAKNWAAILELIMLRLNSSSAIAMYYNIVMYSLYKTIRKDQRRLMPDYQQNYNVDFSSNTIGV